MRGETKLMFGVLAFAALLIFGNQCPPPPDRDAATIDSLTAVSTALRARADSLDALPQVVDTTVLTRWRTRTDTLLVGPKIALVGPAQRGDTVACWPLPAFRAWQNGLRASIEAERAEANEVLSVWTRRAEAERSLRVSYQQLADSSLGVARGLDQQNQRLRRPRVSIAPYIGVGIQSNGSAGIQIGVGLTYQRRRHESVPAQPVARPAANPVRDSSLGR